MDPLRQQIVAQPARATRPADEETPLLPPPTPSRSSSTSSLNRKPTRLPWPQVVSILGLQFIEPLTAQIIDPFVSELIRTVGITGGDESQTVFYVGLLQSVFFAAQALTILFWSSLSDQIGRRPVLIIGAVGIAMASISFGLSSSYTTLMLSRSLLGGLNGYVGVVKTVMAEITDSSNTAQAFSYMPIAWSAGATFGPLIGGQLANPTERIPSLFGNSTFFKQHPYVLVMTFPMLFALLAALWTHFKVQETNPAHGKIPPSEKFSRPASSISILTLPVIIATFNYAVLSLVDKSYRSVRPTFLASPIGSGGLGLAPPAIGGLIALAGLSDGLIQVLLFNRLHSRFGTKRLYLLCIPLALPVIFSFPVMRYISELHGEASAAVWVVFGIQAVSFSLYSTTAGCIFVSIVASAPDRRTVGIVNGIAQLAVSVIRTVAPSFVNTLFSISIRDHALGGNLVWFALFGLLFFVFGGGLLMRAATKPEEELEDMDYE